jgi:flagellar protein FlaJ
MKQKNVKKKLIKKNLNLDVKSLIKKKKESVLEKEYLIYETSSFGKLSNKYMGKLTNHLTKNYPKFFDSLYPSLKSSGIKVLSKTYVSIMLFFSVLAFLFIFIIALLFLRGFILFTLLKAIILGLVAAVITFTLVYTYPMMLVNSMRKKIKDELPFVVIHMAAIAGGGAQPIAMFNLILNSEEYKGLRGEIKKIVNYVNLFGYDLPTALRTVASTTPSKDFRELLNGLVTTIESGGSLKSYLDAKATDLMNSYRLERKKYVETISTYSDVYTGILIAAPLLFFVTLAIIQLLGGAIMGFSAKTLATIGTFVAIPILNVAFLIFLNFIQPKA